jgi:hypothetical protein
VCGVRCAINNRVCRVCLALRGAAFARVALIAASAGLPDALAPALAGLCAPVLVRLCVSCRSSRPRASSRISSPHRWWRASSCPPPTPPPPPLRQHPLRLRRLSAFALAASRSDSSLRLRVFSVSTGTAGFSRATPPPPRRRNELRRSRHRFCGRQHFRGGCTPQGGRGCRRFVPRPCGRGRGCRQFLRAFFLRQWSSSARIRSSSAESFCSSDTIFSSPSRSFSSRYSRARAVLLGFSVIYLTPPLFLRVHFVPIRLPLLMRLLYGMRLLRFFIFFVFLY